MILCPFSEKSFVPEAANHVAETGIFAEHPDDKDGTSPEAGISPIYTEPLPPNPEAFWVGSLKTLGRKKSFS